MFAPGDIVEVFAGAASKTKYHLCVLGTDGENSAKFFYINSHKGYEGDFVLKNADIDCLPPNATGESIVSCSVLVRYNEKQLKLYKAKKVGTFDKKHAASLIAFLEKSPALTPDDKKTAIAGLKRIK